MFSRFLLIFVTSCVFQYGDDLSSMCSVDMSNADSGRGSNDGDSGEQAKTDPNIRTSQLDSGAYYLQPQQVHPKQQQHPQQNISNMFKRDVLYRSSYSQLDSGAASNDKPPARPPRATITTAPDSVYAKPLPRRQNSEKGLSNGNGSSCPVHSNRNHGNGDFHGNREYPQQQQQPAIPPRMYKDDIVIKGVLDNEIHV